MKQKILKALKEVFPFILVYNWALSIWIIIQLVPICKELGTIILIPIIVLTIIAIVEPIFFVYWIVQELRLKKLADKACAAYFEGVNRLKTEHGIRYQNFLKNDIEDIEYTNQVIQQCAEDLISLGQDIINSGCLSEKQITRIKSEIKEIEYLKNNVQPKNGALL